MNLKKTAVSTLAILALGSLATLAQEPVQDIDKHIHPNLAAAQTHVVEANNYIATAQKDNKYDMKGHAEKARQLLVEVNNEIKMAADAANASMKRK